MIVEFEKVKSKYIQKKFLNKKNNKKNRDYISKLIKYEKFILGEWKPFGLYSGHFYNSIKDSKDYAAILKELNPKEYKKYLLDKKKDLKEEKEITKKSYEEKKRESQEEKESFERAQKKFKKNGEC